MHKLILTLGVATFMALSTNVNANQVDPVKQEQGIEILQALFDTAYGEGNVNVRTGEFDREAVDKFDKEYNFTGPGDNHLQNRKRLNETKSHNPAKPKENHLAKPVKPKQNGKPANNRNIQNHKSVNNQHREAR